MTDDALSCALGAEETLENSLSWVPKVQGRKGRISQAKGQRPQLLLPLFAFRSIVFFKLPIFAQDRQLFCF